MDRATDILMSPWTAVPVETDGIQKVTVVRSIYDVCIPPASEETRLSLLRYQSKRRLMEPAISRGDQMNAMGILRSEPAFHRMALRRSASEQMLSNRRRDFSELQTDSSKRAKNRQTRKHDGVSVQLPAMIEDNPMTKVSALDVSPLSLDIQLMDTNFDIEELLREAEMEIEMDNSSDTSGPTSSSPEMWEEKSRYCSSASSNSTLRSNFEDGNASSRTKPIQPLIAHSSSEMKEDRTPKRRSREPRTKPVLFSQETRRRKEQYLQQKPLPAIPTTLSIVTNQSNQHVAVLASKYSSSGDESPIDRLLVLQTQEKAFSQAANELERELKKTADLYPVMRPEQPLIKLTKDDENAVSPLNVSPKYDISSKTGFITNSLGPNQRENVSTRKQSHTYKAFPSPENPNLAASSNKIQPNRHNTESPIDMQPAEITIKRTAQTSQSPRSVSHKIKSSVHLPHLRRPRFNSHSVHPKQLKENKRSNASTRYPVKTLREEQAALAKSTDRYIDTEIAKALNVEHDEEEDGDAMGSKDPKENEWSTMYPLKAVKKLGIPLLTNSHIPRLSSSDIERTVRQQLPKLDTNSLLISSPTSTVSERRYPETPEDIGVRVRSFIANSIDVQSPREENHDMDIGETLHNEKIFVGFDRMETMPEDFSLKTEEISVVMDVPTTTQPLRATFPPRKESLYELGEHGSTPIPSTPNSIYNMKLSMPAQLTDEVVLALMRNVDNLDGLFKYAQVNRQFYQVFKSNELQLIKNALFNMNPPAWELREMSPPWSDISDGLKDPDAPVPEYTATSYLQHYARDVFALVRLKALIYSRCSSIVRSETIGGLTGEDDVRASEIDEAFWRVWTFCRIFGCGKNREGDINGQIDWLNGGYLAKKSKSGATVVTAEPFFSMNNVLFDPPAGFGDGNGDGLTWNQLYDMLEIWNCLGTLVQGFHRECKEARVAGIFDGLDIPVGDIAKEEAMLEEWTHYLLTLGPSALVGLSSVTSSYSAKDIFAKAKQMGVTKWEASEDGSTRSSFLREAISRTYNSRVAIQHKLSNSSASDYSVASGRERTRNYNSAGGRRPGHLLYTDCTDEDNTSNQRAPPYTSRNDDSAFTAPLLSPPPRYSITENRLIDPVDKAIHRMVHELGFSERDATWALKITDTGDMLDINAAIQLLVRERQKRDRVKRFDNPDDTTASGRDDCLVDISRHRGIVSWRWA
ncbi:F-box domain protein [Talaromyces stipitatus ATCC 10500]|uniref:F-box domain protein n=1 Tax=Talaromyces stipitatus (strain ATCC 10500 / CBS 375.48 / QM 6759 / NRRL 1006) TaxID=441959 RepID=B8M4R2_TALSN|nr:F-box domain protein [Talaromyces stipitatus ATCC 10500]EED19257.1 F-box domain protein [Talaromyces stipitatus ATCC 10500]